MIEDQLKKEKDVESNLSRTLFKFTRKAGITMLKLADGSSVEIGKKYLARISASEKQIKHSIGYTNGFEDLIKMMLIFHLV